MPPDLTHLLVPLLIWIRVLIGCAVLLLMEAALLLTFSWARRRSWWLRLSALVPLAAGIGAALAQQQLYNTYLYWLPLAEYSTANGEPNDVTDYAYPGAIQAISEASILGWFIVIITTLLLVAGLFALVRWSLSDRRDVRNQATKQPSGEFPLA